MSEEARNFDFISILTYIWIILQVFISKKWNNKLRYEVNITKIIHKSSFKLFTENMYANNPLKLINYLFSLDEIKIKNVRWKANATIFLQYLLYSKNIMIYT